MSPVALWLALHGEIPHPDEPERIVLLTVKVCDLFSRGSGKVLLDGREQAGTSFQRALAQEVQRAVDHLERGGAEAARRVD